MSSSPYQQQLKDLSKEQVERAKTHGRVRHAELYSSVGLNTKGRGAYSNKQIEAIWKWHCELTPATEKAGSARVVSATVAATPMSPFKQPSSKEKVQL